MASAPTKTHRWDDPLFLEDRLSEDERMIRDSARAYCQDKPVSYTHLTLPTTPYV